MKFTVHEHGGNGMRKAGRAFSVGAIVAAALAAAGGPASATPPLELAKLTASDGAVYEQHGYAVAIDGTTTVVGAIPAVTDPGGVPGPGAAYVYTPDGLGGYTETKLTPSDGFENDQFGAAVAVSGDTIVVGARRANPSGEDSGAAYVYTPDGLGGYDEAKLLAADGAQDDQFGFFVAVSGDNVLVGARKDDEVATDAGAAYVFTPDGLGGYTQTKLTASDGAAEDWFGASVGMSGDTIVVGAALNDGLRTDSGSAYVFTPDGLGGYTETKVVASDGKPGDLFGYSVAASGDRVVVGAQGRGMGTGAVYIYDPDGVGGFTEARVTATDGVAFDYFSRSVSVSGDTIVAGSGNNDMGTDSGATYVFQDDGLGGFIETKFVAADTASMDSFGASVSVSGSTIAVGAPGDETRTGAAYLFSTPEPNVPAAPTIGTATRGYGEATVTWTAPSDNGGAPITGYVVTPYIGTVAQTPATFASTATVQTVTGLTEGSTYTFKVAATNAVGTGPQSAATNAVTLFPGATYVSITPCRVVDTRLAGGPLGTQGERSFIVTGSTGFTGQGGKSGGCGIPEGTVAVEASVSAVTPSSDGYMRAWPAGTPMPTATILNFSKDQEITNTGTIPLATTGATHLTLHNFAGPTHYVIDIQGYFSDTAPVARYVSITPCRVVDTRVAGGSLGTQGERSFIVTGSTGFTGQGGKSGGCGIPAGAVAVEASVSAVTPSSDGYMRAWPAGTPMPTATILNFVKDQNVTNTGTIPLATTGSTHLTLHNFAGPTHYVIDIQGYYSTTAPGTTYISITPCRVVDTRLGGGALAAYAERSFIVRGAGGFAAQGGKQGGCGIPTNAVAVEASVSAVTPASAGYMRAWPAATPPPIATILNFVKAQEVTNTGTIPLGTSGANNLTLRSFATGTTHYVIDIQGYFVA